MMISEVIAMLEAQKEKHGDIEVWVEEDRGIRPVEEYDTDAIVSPEYYAGPPEMILL